MAAFHLVPLVLDAAAISVLQEPRGTQRLRAAVPVRWVGESANSLMPAGALGGPLLMVRQLTQRGVPGPEAVAVITASTTLQSFAQLVFAAAGIVVLGGRLARFGGGAARSALLLAGAGLVLMLVSFFVLQHRGLFAALARLAQRLVPRHEPAAWLHRAQAIDAALRDTYRRRGAAWGSFFLSLAGWVAGTGEVWLVLWLLRAPVGLGPAFILESLGQAVRGAAFAVPGALGVQEGGYLLLGPLVGLPPDVVLALALAKRARELILGLPGLAYLYRTEHGRLRRPP